MGADRHGIQAALTSALPEHSRWMLGGTPLDFRFTVARDGLQSLPPDVLKYDDGAWSDLLVFGECDYGEGGGARPLLCIRANTGEVCGLDLERDVAVFPLNSLAERFVATFWLLDGYLAHDRPLPADCERQLRAIDPEIGPESEWFLFLN